MLSYLISHYIEHSVITLSHVVLYRINHLNKYSIKYYNIHIDYNRYNIYNILLIINLIILHIN